MIDFGIARLAATITLGAGTIGTPAYMAPEQVEGGPIGAAADMWAWAMTMAYAASGRTVVDGAFAQRILARIAAGDFVLPAMDEPMATLVARCTSHDPAARPAARDVLAGLTGLPDTLSDDQIMHAGARLAGPRTSATGDHAALAERSLADGALPLAIRYAEDGLAARGSVELTRADARCHHVLGLARTARGEDGLPDLRLAYEIQRDDPAFSASYGRALAARGETAAAYGVAPHDDEVVDAYTTWIIDRASRSFADVTTAEVEETLTLGPRHPEAPRLRRRLLLTTAEGVRRAFALEPDVREVRVAYADLLSREGGPGIRQAMALAPEAPFIVDRYVDLLLTAGEHRETLGHLARVWPSLTPAGRAALCRVVLDGLHRRRAAVPRPVGRVLAHDIAAGMLALPVPPPYRTAFRSIRIRAYGGRTAFLVTLVPFVPISGFLLFVLMIIVQSHNEDPSQPGVSGTEAAVIVLVSAAPLLLALLVALSIARFVRHTAERRLRRHLDP